MEMTFDARPRNGDFSVRNVRVYAVVLTCLSRMEAACCRTTPLLHYSQIAPIGLGNISGTSNMTTILGDSGYIFVKKSPHGLRKDMLGATQK